MDSRTGGSFGAALGVPPETCSSSSALSSLLVDSCLFVAAVLIAVIMGKPDSCATPFGPAILVTQDPNWTLPAVN